MPDEQSMQPMQAMKPAEPTRSKDPRQAMPLPLRPIAHVDPKPAAVAPTEAKQTAAVEGAEGADAVVQLAGALRTAERAHRAYLAELGQGDVEPAEDWSTWYAEYLLGLR